MNYYNLNSRNEANIIASNYLLLFNIKVLYKEKLRNANIFKHVVDEDLPLLDGYFFYRFTVKIF